MLVSILLHVIVFFALDQMKIAFKFEQARELSTKPIDVSQMQVRPMDLEKSLPPEDVIQPPKDSAALLDEVELLDILPKDQQIDIKPAIIEAEYALQMKNPAAAGNPEATALEISAGLEVDADLPELGREPVNIKPAEIGQMTVDPGAALVDDNEIGKFTDDLIKRGANGKVENGTLDGVISLDSLLDLPANILLSKKTMLPSDLLFEFNSSELRESAKVGLMKLGLLMDRNPGLYCWIEGHTDLVGGDEFNLNLSIKRAEAVKNYLVTSLRMARSKIITRGFGRYEPLIITGTAEEQSANRRVEIRMRKTPPTLEQAEIGPQKTAVIEPVVPKATVAPAIEPPAIAPPPVIAPKPVLVKPRRALPVEEERPPEAEPPRASPVPQELEAVPAAPIPRASIPRAEPVEE